MARIGLSMYMEQRPAEYTVPYNRSDLGLTKGQVVKVGVFGLYPVQVEEEIDAYFIVELPGGRCTYTNVKDIRFTDVPPVKEEAE